MKSGSFKYLTAIALFAIGSAVAFSSARAQQAETVRWENDYNKASALARETNRLFLVHFYGNNCPPCKLMDANVFTNPAVIAEMNRNFVVLKVDIGANEELAKQFGVQLIPTDIVVKPDGQIMNRRQGGIAPERFVQYLDYLKKKSGIGEPKQSPALLAAVPQPVAQAVPAFQVAPAAPQVPTQAAPSFVLPAPPMAQETKPVPPEPVTAGTINLLQDPFTKQPVAAPAHAERETSGERGNPVRMSDPEASENGSRSGPATVELPLGLEGYCPVVLCEEERWVPGNPAYFAMFRGKVYRFSDENAMVRFLKTPQGFAPIATGEDIVLMVDRNRKVDGLRKFGVWFQDRVYLFSSQESLDAFAARPDYYAEIARQYETALNKPFDTVQR